MKKNIDIILKYFPDASPIQIKQFDLLYSIYLEWNSKINVISRKDMDSFYERHVLHSLGIAKILKFQSQAIVLDVGTGGGFPGIPLAILFPDVDFILVDSVGKKTKVVREVSKSIGLRNTIVLKERAENIKGAFDFVVSRAVTNMTELGRWLDGKIHNNHHNSLKNGILALKGGDLSEELTGFSFTQYNISEFFDEDFFKTKKIIYIET